MKCSKPASLFVASLSLFTAAVAMAADPTPEAREPMRDLARICRPDAERLCAAVEKGGGRKMTCLRSHSAELSPACKDGLAKAAAARKGGASN